MATNADIYVNPYMQTHVERVRKSIEIARNEAWAQYGMEEDRLKFLRKQEEDLRDYVIHLSDSLDDYIKATTSKKGAGGDDDGTAELDAMRLERQVLADSQNQKDQNADRELQAIAAVEKRYQIGDNATRAKVIFEDKLTQAMTNATVAERAAPDFARRQAGIAMLDPSVQAAMAGLDTDEQKRAFASELVTTVVRATGGALREDTAREETVKLTGVGTVDNIKADVIEAEKQAGIEDVKKKAHVGGAEMAEQRRLAEKLKGMEGGGDAETPESLAARQALFDAAGLTAGEWQDIKADLADDGTINLSPRGVTGLSYDEKRAQVATAKAQYGAMATAGISSLPAEEKRYFDQIFLQRLAALAQAKGKLDAKEMQVEAAQRDLAIPPEELIRARASAIYAPERRRPVFQSASEQAAFKQETARRQAAGSLPAAKAALSSRQAIEDRVQSLPTDGRILYSQARVAQALLASGGIGKHGPRDEKAREISNAMDLDPEKKKALVALASDWAGTDTAKRDDLIARVLALQLEKYRSTQL